jgi:hypothetical protein
LSWVGVLVKFPTEVLDAIESLRLRISRRSPIAHIMGCCCSATEVPLKRDSGSSSSEQIAEITIGPLTEAEAARLTQSAHIRGLLLKGIGQAEINAQRYELMYACNGGRAHGFVRDANPGGPDDEGRWRFKRGGAPVYGVGAGACVAAIEVGIVGDEETRAKIAEFEPETGRKLGMGTCYGSDRFTLLHYACVEDEPELVALLLRHGGSLQAMAGSLGKRGVRAQTGVSALHVATGNRNTSVERAIFEHLRTEKKRLEKLNKAISSRQT